MYINEKDFIKLLISIIGIVAFLCMGHISLTQAQLPYNSELFGDALFPSFSSFSPISSFHYINPLTQYGSLFSPVSTFYSRSIVDTLLYHENLFPDLTTSTSWYSPDSYRMITPWQSLSPNSVFNTYSSYNPQQFLFNQPYTTGSFFQFPYSFASYSLYLPYYSPISQTTCTTTSYTPGLYGKPAIYLYPEEDTRITVELDINGVITKTIPPYNEGWKVIATKEGIIVNEEDGEKYDYLFWEADPDALDLPDSGWVVAQEDLEKWFYEYLDKLGLNKKEKTQFMEYWLAQLQYGDYYEISLLSGEFLDEHARLIITPQPDTMIRVIFHFRPIDEAKFLNVPDIKTPKRKGFVVVEWGGIVSLSSSSP